MTQAITTRRDFLATSGALFAAAPLLRAGAAASNRDELRVALIGCGGRGTGAAVNALSTAGAVRFVAMADAFADRLEDSLGTLERHFGARSGRVDVPPERRFVGFDAFRGAIDQDVDVVLLATPPGFRPSHFEYAVAKGRHVFMEKPVAVDGPGVRKVLAAAKAAKAKRLKIGVGLQRHHDPRYLATVKRIHEGVIGDVVLLRVYWNGSGVWTRPRQPEWTEMEYQMRNWYYFNWLCGDHIVEQHIHNLDVGNWVMNRLPVAAQGQGGRQVRTGKDSGEIYDHHMVEYTFENGAKMLSQCRHIPGCHESVSEHAHGTLGSADVGGGRISLPGGTDWRHRGEDGDPFQLEHDALFAAIREDREHDESERGAHASLTAIMGRMATYSGQVVTFEQALASEIDLMPQSLAFDALPKVLPDADGRYPIAVPGVTRAV
jgi:myo-inositol 2-dehydrogenase/D-chiro-inositol 1-dehydrogenase